MVTKNIFLFFIVVLLFGCQTTDQKLPCRGIEPGDTYYHFSKSDMVMFNHDTNSYEDGWESWKIITGKIYDIYEIDNQVMVKSVQAQREPFAVYEPNFVDRYDSFVKNKILPSDEYYDLLSKYLEEKAIYAQLDESTLSSPPVLPLSTANLPWGVKAEIIIVSCQQAQEAFETGCYKKGDFFLDVNPFIDTPCVQ